MLNMEILFYLFAVLCAYSYFIYPILLRLIPAREVVRGVDSAGVELPALSLIITVHNEAGRIREKLENTLQVDYPSDLLEIIIASDFLY